MPPCTLRVSRWSGAIEGVLVRSYPGPPLPKRPPLTPQQQQQLDDFRRLLQEHAVGSPPPLTRGPEGLVNEQCTWGIPCKPLVASIARALAAWAVTGVYPFPVVEFEKAFNLNEGPRPQECLAQMRGQVERLAAVLREAEEGRQGGTEEGLVGRTEEGVVRKAEEGVVREAEEGVVRKAEEGVVRKAEEGVVRKAEEGVVREAEEGSEKGVVRKAEQGLVEGGMLVDAEAPHNGISDPGGSHGGETACVISGVCVEAKGWCTGSGQGQEAQCNGAGAAVVSGARGEGRSMVVDDVEGVGARGSEGSLGVAGADAGAGEDSAVVLRAGAEAGAGGSATSEATTGEGSVTIAGTEECATAKESAPAVTALGEGGVNFSPGSPVLRPLVPALTLSEGQAERLRCVLDEMLEDRQCVFLLLGCRLTVGTNRSASIMPSPEECVLAFCELNAPDSKSRLTCGARALAKHNHRDETKGWWGSLSGSEPVKNARALQVLARILSGAMWLNLHYLPPNRSVLEVRVKEGYGARWEVAGLDAPVDMCSMARASPAPTAPASAAASEGGAAADVRVDVDEVHAHAAAVDDATSAMLAAGVAPGLGQDDGASAAASAAAAAAAEAAEAAGAAATAAEASEAAEAAVAPAAAPPPPAAPPPETPPAAAAAVAAGPLPEGPPQPRWWGDLDGGQVVLEEPILVKFRGFLEPQVADGHALGWRH